jgi:hypothetical protein
VRPKQVRKRCDAEIKLHDASFVGNSNPEERPFNKKKAAGLSPVRFAYFTSATPKGSVISFS